MTTELDAEALVAWFTTHGGTFDRTALAFASLPAQGWGAVALRDLQEGHTLFALPRDLTLSTRTSALPPLIGAADWAAHGLHEGWAGLILCLMWEAAQGASSKWSAYLASLPTTFDTPMFWRADDLAQLAGTAVADKIGKAQAERDYATKVVPVLQRRPDLFGAFPDPRYALDTYHMMGSRILSRSFQVEAPAPGEEADAAMDTDAPQGVSHASSGDGEGQLEQLLDDDSDSDDEDDPADVAMVPMADMLNARHGSENAKLFYEAHDLRMATTRPVRAGEQIWNTYGDPPNSDLLRRYGHVDLVPLPGAGGSGALGNPADIVEVRADLVVASVAQRAPGAPSAERVDWWLEEGGDDVFVADGSGELPEELVSFARLLLLPAPEWEKTRRKSKLPKPKTDAAVLAVAADVLRRRLAEYPTTLECAIPLNLKHALVVRVGEKRILHALQRNVAAQLAEPPSSDAASSSKKRKAEAGAESTSLSGRRKR
ncbi:hypothetical protein BC834DRAFT_867511 [Gloeopeniophorella convolvens]|nr:hypothetical protein BC834DRAFT_867511 [Gloeopeniophorella convolvens]